MYTVVIPTVSSNAMLSGDNVKERPAIFFNSIISILKPTTYKCFISTVYIAPDVRAPL